jgi:hypothetical protein
MTPSDLNWPVCPKKGFQVNPKKRCPKCKQKGKVKWSEAEQKWTCSHGGAAAGR